jgi:hypothetical protein
MAVPTSTETTLFLRYGDVVGRMAVVLAVLLFAWLFGSWLLRLSRRVKT